MSYYGYPSSSSGYGYSAGHGHNSGYGSGSYSTPMGYTSSSYANPYTSSSSSRYPPTSYTQASSYGGRTSSRDLYSSLGYAAPSRSSHRRDSHGRSTETKKPNLDRYGNGPDREYKRDLHRAQVRVNYHSRRNQGINTDLNDLWLLQEHKERKDREREDRDEEKREKARDRERRKRAAKLEKENKELERRVAEMRSRPRMESRAGVNSDGSSYYVNRHGIRTNY